MDNFPPNPDSNPSNAGGSSMMDKIVNYFHIIERYCDAK